MKRSLSFCFFFFCCFEHVLFSDRFPDCGDERGLLPLVHGLPDAVLARVRVAICVRDTAREGPPDPAAVPALLGRRVSFMKLL